MKIHWTPALNELIELLADLYGDGRRARTIVPRIPLRAERLDLSGAPVEVWYDIVREANNSGLIPNLLRVAKEDYPNIDFDALGPLLAAARFEAPKPAKWSEAPAVGATLEAITGSQPTFLPISFLEKGLRRARSVGRIENRHLENPIATGFLTRENVLITNNHVIRSMEVAGGMQVRFNYQEDDAGFAETSRYFLEPDSLFETCAVDDWTAVRVAGDPNKDWGSIDLEERSVRVDSFVNIIQHPAGLPKQIALYHNVVKFADNVRVQYLTDTFRGSSGSPVFDSAWEVVALHHSGGLLIEPGTKESFFRNEGIAVSALVKGLRKKGVLK